MEQEELSLLVEMQNSISHFGKYLVSYKIKHALTIWSYNCAPWYLPKGVENISHNIYAGMFLPYYS